MQKKYYMYNKSLVFEFSNELYLAQNMQFCLGTPHPNFTLPDEQISNRVHNVITYVEYM